MGFMINFKTFEITEYVKLVTAELSHTAKPRSTCVLKLVNLNTLRNVIFFDLEVDDIIRYQESTDTVYIPNIREWSFLYSENYNSVKIAPECLYYHKTTTDYATTIHKFWECYAKVGAPTIIAHNGCNFDFLILIAHSYRYRVHPAAFLDNVKWFDSYVMVKEKLNFPIRKSNGALFERYLQFYPQHRNLLIKAHNATEDCLMLALWFSAYLKN